MGSVGRNLFGGSEEKSNTHNQAFPMLSGPLGGVLNTGAQAGGQLAGLLGLGGSGQQGQAFDQFKNSTGYQFGENQGIQGIVGSNATKGLLNSGGTLKDIDKWGQDYASTKYGDYTNLLQGLLGSGIQGGGVLAGAGNVSNSSGSSTKGAGGFLGSLLAK